MTDQQLHKANRLKAERDDIQALIDFLTNDNHRPCFGIEVKKKYLFLSVFKFFNLRQYKEFSYATKEVITKALIERRDQLTNEIQEL
uniref:Uncharacterized protein n=1 Tax=Dulem virus 40 TaxID=3145758 RepID=A0AAU8AW93_9CAUD